MLIIFNTALESFGLPYYKITAENLSNIDYNKLFDYIMSWILCLVNFYSVIFLVFRIKEFKKIFLYSILYLVLNVLITVLTNNVMANIYIPLFIVIFCYFYSKRNWKYILYGLGSYALNVIIQYICYLYKLRFINFEQISYLNVFLTSFDFLIIVFVIIFIKEIFLKNRKEVS